MPAPQADNNKFLEEFGAKSADFSLAWAGPGMSIVHWLGWDQILAPELNSISAKMLGHHGVSKRS